MTIYAKKNGVYVEVSNLITNQHYTDKISIKQGDTWYQVYPETGTWTRSEPGTYYFIVPPGVLSLTISLLVAGGGGGGSAYIDAGAGQFIPGTYGGSGGFRRNVTLTVTPEEQLTIIVGAGGNGQPGSNYYGGGGNYQFHHTGLGGAGGGSSIYSPSGGTISVTGGNPGYEYPGSSGTGGSPGGVTGGNNGTGYGNAGAGGGGGSPGYPGDDGQKGYISFSYG